MGVSSMGGHLRRDWLNYGTFDSDLCDKMGEGQRGHIKNAQDSGMERL